MRRLPPLNSLPAFEATARLGSVTAAAEELGRTHGAVSKQLRNLSEDLGVALFEKDGVGLKLTHRGERLRAAAVTALDGLDVVARALRSEGDVELLEIGVSATFAMRWLMARMPRFYQRRPGAEVRLLMTGRTRHADSEVDAVLTWGRLEWPLEGRADVIRIGDVSFGPVMSPELASTPIEGGRRVETRIEHEDTPTAWVRWEELSGGRIEAAHHVAYPHTFLAIEAAVYGLGVALAERRLVERELDEGRLVAPFGFATIPDGFGVMLRDRGRGRPVVDAFLEWLEQELRVG